MAFNPFDSSKDINEEHERMLMDLQSLMSHSAGKNFIKYLFKNFMVGELPPISMEGAILHDYTGFLRAGQSIFEIASQADPTTAGLILSELQKEKYNVKK